MVQQYRKNNEAKRFQVPSEEEESVGENVEKFLGERFGCDATAVEKATDMWYQVQRRFFNPALTIFRKFR